MSSIKYDNPIQVSKKQLSILRKHYGGTFAWRVDGDGQYWVKVWDMRYLKHIEAVLSI